MNEWMNSLYMALSVAEALSNDKQSPTTIGLDDEEELPGSTT